MLLSRKTRTWLPAPKTTLRPRVTNHRRTLDARRNEIERFTRAHNKGAHKRPPLAVNDEVRVQPFSLGDRKWKKAIITRSLPNGCSEIHMEGRKPVRRGNFLKKTDKEESKENRGEEKKERNRETKNGESWWENLPQWLKNDVSDSEDHSSQKREKEKSPPVEETTEKSGDETRFLRERSKIKKPHRYGESTM